MCAIQSHTRKLQLNMHLAPGLDIQSNMQAVLLLTMQAAPVLTAGRELRPRLPTTLVDDHECAAWWIGVHGHSL